MVLTEPKYEYTGFSDNWIFKKLIQKYGLLTFSKSLIYTDFRSKKNIFQKSIILKGA